MLKKIERLSNEAVLDLYRGRPCTVCDRPSDPCHIRSVGAGGDDTDSNLLALCREHHTEQHSIGWGSFYRKYRAVALALNLKGWSLDNLGRLRFNRAN